jgi:hypothetical protein
MKYKIQRQCDRAILAYVYAVMGVCFLHSIQTHDCKMIGVLVFFHFIIVCAEWQKDEPRSSD